MIPSQGFKVKVIKFNEVLDFLGGMQVVGYMTQKNRKSPNHISHAMIVSTPFDVTVTYEEMEKWGNIALNKTITQRVKKMVERSELS